MVHTFSRTQLLLGGEGMERLRKSAVAVFGVGGVGSFAVEALARSGVGAITIFDDDSVCLTNINRQLIALHSTVGRKKVDVMRERILDINPHCQVQANACFYAVQNADEYDLSGYSYIIDAIDTVSAKLLLIERAHAAGVPIISSMGAGNKLDPTRLEVADIYQTSVCPLARVMRKELRARGIPSLKVVYSREEALTPLQEEGVTPELPPAGSSRRQVPGSVAFVPSVAGLILAAEVIRSLSGCDR